MPPPRHELGEASYPLLSQFGLVYNIVPVSTLLQRLGARSAWQNFIPPLSHLVDPYCLPAQLLLGEAPVTPLWKCHPALRWICLAYWILRH